MIYMAFLILASGFKLVHIVINCETIPSLMAKLFRDKSDTICRNCLYEQACV